MATIFRRNKSLYNSMRHMHKHAEKIIVPSFDMKSERKAFLGVLPEVIDTVVTGPKLAKLPEVQSWIKQLLEYMLGGGKLGRGLMVSFGYRMFEEPENFSEKTQHEARVLGWCLEMLQAHFLILDDLVDSGVIRRGKPCWHRRPDVGISAVNDALLINQSMMEVLEIYFGKRPMYTNLLREFNKTVYKACMGAHLDLWTSYNQNKVNFDVLNMERIYEDIAVHKTAYYCFRLPIFAPLFLVKNGENKATKELNDICMDFGRLMQCQDDYMDAYGEETVTGKNGRDIQEGKCSWAAVTALKHCNDAQRAIFKECYGNDNPEHVKRIKQLYDELHLPQLYEQCERSIYDDIVNRTHALPTERERNFILEVLNATYKRVY